MNEKRKRENLDQLIIKHKINYYGIKERKEDGTFYITNKK